MRTEFFFLDFGNLFRVCAPKNQTTNGGGPAAGARSTNSQTPHNSSLSRRPTIKILVSHHPSPPKKAPSDLRAQTEKKEKKGDFASLRAVAAARRRAAARVVGGALAGVLDALPVASMLHGAAATRPAVVRRIVIGRAPVAQSASHALHLRPLARQLARLARSFKVLFDLFLPSHQSSMQGLAKKKFWRAFRCLARHDTRH